VISHVKQEYDRELKAFLTSVPQDKLLNFIGPDFTKRVVNEHIKATGAKKKAPTAAVVGTQLEKKEAPKPETLRNFFRNR